MERKGRRTGVLGKIMAGIALAKGSLRGIWKGVEGDNEMKVFSVVVRMTSPDGNRYERNVHVEAKNELEARVLAEAEAEKDNREYVCRARGVVSA